jgi:hypothetical protein
LQVTNIITRKPKIICKIYKKVLVYPNYKKIKIYKIKKL